jgi:carbamoyltransferase
MIVLGLSGALKHDPSAALLVDGETVAAAEEERFIRDKHAKNKVPLESARFCLEFAGLKPQDVDYVAFPYAPISLFTPARWQYARRYWYAPDRALDAILNGNRRFRNLRRSIVEMGNTLGIDWSKTQFVPVEHHLSHASSAYHLSGFKDKCAVLGVDGKGEYATTFFGYGEGGHIHKIKEFYDPDSLGGLYGAMTEYLGFEMLDGEYKVMGMAPYGDPTKYDLSRLIKAKGRGFEVNTQYANVVGLRRHKDRGQSFFFTDKLIEWLGPRRIGDAADDPYIHYAAAMQDLFEQWVLKLIDHYLADVLAETGQLAFAGGGALNVKLNQRLLARGDIEELFVQPASGDSGTALGAATYVAQAKGDAVAPLRHVYLGPRYDNDACLQALQACAEPCHWQKMSDPVAQTADILTAGNPVAWFHGRMEFGPRALGGRSILGCPNAGGIADRINEQIKFRERWRPFCPSMLDRIAPEILQTEHPAPYMTITFDVAQSWKSRIPEVVHEDGTARAQVVDAESNPRYYALLEAMEARTGNGVLLNTSLNRRGEPMICSPADALNMFFGSDLEYLVLEDWLVTKPQTPDS